MHLYRVITYKQKIHQKIVFHLHTVSLSLWSPSFEFMLEKVHSFEWDSLAGDIPETHSEEKWRVGQVGQS